MAKIDKDQKEVRKRGCPEAREGLAKGSAGGKPRGIRGSKKGKERAQSSQGREERRSRSRPP